MSSHLKSRWLANTLLVLATALVLFGALWAFLGSRWSNALDEKRARWSTRGWPTTSAELFPPIDSEDDAAPIYRDAVAKLASWRKSEEVEFALHDACEAIGVLRFRPDQWSAEQERALDVLDAPELQDALVRLHDAAEKRHCRMVDPEQFPFGWPMSRDLLEFECMRDLRRGNHARAGQHLESALALAAHSREGRTLISLWLSDAWAKGALSALEFFVELGQVETGRVGTMLGWIERFQPDEDLLRAYDGERILFIEPAWTALRAGTKPMSVWLPADPTGLLYSKLLLPWRSLDESKYWELYEHRREWLCAHPWDPEPSQEIPAIFPITRDMWSRQLTGKLLATSARRGRDLAEIALRLVQFHSSAGSYPITLDALGAVPREPKSERSYVYSRVGDGFALGLPEGVTEAAPSAWPMKWSAAR